MIFNQPPASLIDPYGPRLQALMGSANLKPEDIQRLISRLPEAAPSCVELDQDRIRVGCAADLNADRHSTLLDALRRLKPWRKGPFSLFGIDVDSEWNSALKWARVAPHIAPLAGRRVLDVGCSNGYYLYRMHAAGPGLVLGIDPYRRYYLQYCLLQHYIRASRVFALPLGLEDLGFIESWFDTVFCMGILYHRRSPLDCLAQLRALLRPGGELVMETLVLEDEAEVCLCPAGRYAAMRNVYFIPSVSCLRNWLTRSGFANVRCVDITRTTLSEQRKTAWIDSASLESFLNPADPRLTIEGYPAPRRATLLADAS
ncbi:MAG: tRNA 5-methoxyuridine(34)/uridine 5-oxyacetic acid(34) synthase CmoB [Desulfosarcinaceae bacterium]